MELKALTALKNWTNGNYPSKNEILEAIKELEQLKDKSCLTCKFVHNCKLANDVKTQFGTKLKEQCFYCWKAK